MAIIPQAGEFPRILALVAGGFGIFAGLFSFIFACILSGLARTVIPDVIILSGVLIAIGVVLLLTGINILTIFQNNLPLTCLLALNAIVVAFVKFVQYCRFASAFVRGSYFSASIVIILLMVGVMAIYGLLAVLLFTSYQRTRPGATSNSTTVTTTRTTHATATTIETPPAGYINQVS